MHQLDVEAEPVFIVAHGRRDDERGISYLIVSCIVMRLQSQNILE